MQSYEYNNISLEKSYPISIILISGPLMTYAYRCPLMTARIYLGYKGKGLNLSLSEYWPNILQSSWNTRGQKTLRNGYKPSPAHFPTSSFRLS